MESYIYIYIYISCVLFKANLYIYMSWWCLRYCCNLHWTPLVPPIVFVILRTYDWYRWLSYRSHCLLALNSTDDNQSILITDNVAKSFQYFDILFANCRCIYVYFNNNMGETIFTFLGVVNNISANLTISIDTYRWFWLILITIVNVLIDFCT